MRAKAGPAVEQLDLFAESEAAGKQRRFGEHRPYSIPGSGATSPGSPRSSSESSSTTISTATRRSHAWHAQLGAMRFGGDQPSDTCRPTILNADLRCNHYNENCFCVGDLVYRGVCLHCDGEGPVRGDETEAAEDAYHHAWPGWRDLPLVPRPPESGTNAKQKQAMTRWAEYVNDIYPTGWLESGGPIRTSRLRCGTRNVPNDTPFGGYDLCGEVREQQRPRQFVSGSGPITLRA